MDQSKPTETPAAVDPPASVEPKAGDPPVEPKADDKSILNKEPTAEEKAAADKKAADDKAKDDKKPVLTGAPDKYGEFKAPEGFVLDKKQMEDAAPIFKELNLSQDGAQKLVDFHAKVLAEAKESSATLWKETQDTWKKEVAADPVIGGKLDQVKATVAKAIDGLGDPKLALAFRQAMDYTGAGNNPSFIRTFYALALKVTEPSHVAGGGPTKVNEPGSAKSPAQRMYPNLP